MLPGARGPAIRNAYKPVKPSAPVPTTLHEMHSLYSHCFSSSDGIQVGVSVEEVDDGEEFDARGGPDILVRAESDAFALHTGTLGESSEKLSVNDGRELMRKTFAIDVWDPRLFVIPSTVAFVLTVGQLQKETSYASIFQTQRAPQEAEKRRSVETTCTFHCLLPRPHYRSPQNLWTFLNVSD